MAKQDMFFLVEKYLNNNISEDELITLKNLLKNDENVKVFKNLVRDDYQIKTKNIEFNAKESLNNIESRLELVKHKKTIQIQSFYKYAIAASVLLLFALGSLLNIKKDSQVIEPILVNEIIEPGTDKATLTLEDGSIIELAKGEAFQTSNADSNGEQIVYGARDRNTKELVYNYLTIPRGGQFHVVLSDGTQVWLNSESQLKYPISFIDGQTRKVELVYGEAYFDVSPSSEHSGSKFKVFNKSQEVEVLGTEFNIKAYKGETNIYTTLAEGKIAVGFDDKKQNLNPNQQFNLNVLDNNFTIAEVDVKKEISWKNGVFSFIDMPLKDIMKVISRWYDVDIIFENEELETIKFIGTLNKSRSIQEVLAVMKSTTINNYEINGKTIILK
ncbi:FecR family protein [Seonamhaeicola sp.]|uniref:FecR family protein n=1 Tax=Seonamhaeicola sp. TaxID=1912245 RepID=UPI00262604C8|nr:FecR family protein [Seonamhaeicola sp.]